MIGREQETRLMAVVEAVAAAEIMPRFRQLSPNDIFSKTSADDLVTIADRETERRLSLELRSIFPDAAIIGEESIAADPDLRDRIAEPGLCIILDPVDGTWNFANGLPLFGVIVAITRDGETIWGGIFDPVIGDWMIARRAEGSWFVAGDGTRTRLHLFDGKEETQARGNLPVYLFAEDRRPAIAALMPSFQRAATLRCSAHDYRMQAQGSFDFSICPVLNPWDHAAGCLLVTEAGGVARLMSGEDYAPTQRVGCLLTARSEAMWRSLEKTFRDVV
jgi:fructose-1,6-bisphosphatase/inositol monophosphatase family enzyme